MISKYAMMMVGAGMIGLATVASANEGVATSEKKGNPNREKMVQRARKGQANEGIREAQGELMKLVHSYNQTKDQDKEKSAKTLEEIKVQIAKTQELRLKGAEKRIEEMKAKNAENSDEKQGKRINMAEKRLEKMKAGQAENGAKILKAIEEGNYPPKSNRAEGNRKGKKDQKKSGKPEKTPEVDKAAKAEDANDEE